MAEFLMKSEPRGPDLMFHNQAMLESENFEGGYFSWGNMEKTCLPMTNSPPRDLLALSLRVFKINRLKLLSGLAG